MESISEEQFQPTVDAIKNVGHESIRLINPYIKADKSSGALLKSANIKSVKISKNSRSFAATTPCYISIIDLYGNNPGLLKSKVNLIATKLDGKEYPIVSELINVTNPDGSLGQLVRFRLGFFCTQIVISADTVLRQVAATKFMAYGFTLGQIESAAAKLIETSSLVAKIDGYAEKRKVAAESAQKEKDRLQQEIVDLENRIESLGEEESRLEQGIDGLSKNSLELEAKKSSLEKDVAEFQTKITTAQNNETQLKESVTLLNREVVTKKEDLRKVLNDRSLISDEYKDYVREGKRQALTYEVFLALAIGVIAFCAWQLYQGAQRILFIDAVDYREVAALVMQRVPFAAALSLVIGAAWKLAEMFVSRVMAIHAQRLALTRLLVIAKDTVYSSVDGLDVPDETKFRERIKLKLQMLKSHLTSELGKDFDYEPEHEANGSANEEQAEQARDGENPQKAS